MRSLCRAEKGEVIKKIMMKTGTINDVEISVLLSSDVGSHMNDLGHSQLRPLSSSMAGIGQVKLGLITLVMGPINGLDNFGSLK